MLHQNTLVNTTSRIHWSILFLWIVFAQSEHRVRLTGHKGMLSAKYTSDASSWLDSHTSVCKNRKVTTKITYTTIQLYKAWMSSHIFLSISRNSSLIDRASLSSSLIKYVISFSTKRLINRIDFKISPNSYFISLWNARSIL